MKKILSTIIVLSFILVFNGTGWALYITDDGTNFTNVGSFDTLISQADLGNSSDSGETAWMTEELRVYLNDSSFTVDDYVKVETFELFQIYNGESLNDRILNAGAFVFSGTPTFYLIKFGDGNGYYSHSLWLNNFADDWGVFLVDGVEIQSVEAFSHYATVGAAPVPEPATMLLLGTGLVGLASLGRKKLILK